MYPYSGNYPPYNNVSYDNYGQPAYGLAPGMPMGPPSGFSGPPPLPGGNYGAYGAPPPPPPSGGYYGGGMPVPDISGGYPSGNYPTSGGPGIGFSLDVSAPNMPDHHVLETEKKQQGEEAGYWSTGADGHRTYTVERIGNDPSPSSYKTGGYGGDRASSPYNGGRASSPYNGGRASSPSYGAGWGGKAPAPPTPSTTTSSGRGGGGRTGDPEDRPERATNDPAYKSKLDNLASLMTDVELTDTELAELRKDHNLK